MNCDSVNWMEFAQVGFSGDSNGSLDSIAIFSCHTAVM